MGGFTYQDSKRRFCSGRRVVHILMGLLLVVTLSLVFFGFMGRQYSATLRKTQNGVKTSNRTMEAELVDLQQQEANNTENLQKVDLLVKRLIAEGKEVKSHFLDQVKKLQGSFQKINCDLEDIKHKREAGGCCPRGWHLFQRSCYWLSPTLNVWNEAKGDCEEKNAHLVVLTSYLEKQFVLRLIKPHNPWIGLKYNGEVWKWVDGTPYAKRRIDWRPSDPNENSVFCTVMYPDGLWGDIYCRVQLKWVCEKPAQA